MVGKSNHWRNVVQPVPERELDDNCQRLLKALRMMASKPEQMVDGSLRGQVWIEPIRALLGQGTFREMRLRLMRAGYYTGVDGPHAYVLIKPPPEKPWWRRR